jgi:arabinan endo-1,5-alpha-L-arabinosidase
LFEGKRYHASITDGAWLHLAKTGRLIMLWSSYGPSKYATGLAVSQSGKLAGPWEQQQETLWLDDGGHPMLFRTFDGRLVMTLHQPNRRVERARFFEMDDTGDTIRIEREITDFTTMAR